MIRPIAWTIAGSDSSGGAGIQADLCVFHHLKVHGASVITSITAQNSETISHIEYLSPDSIAAQISALKSELPAKAIKIGMLGRIDVIDKIIQFSENYAGKIVLDPVMISTSGKVLFADNQKIYIEKLMNIFSYIYLLTPNIPEVEMLLGKPIKTYDDTKDAAKIFLSFGIKNVLIKGGHFKQDIFSQDYWTNGDEAYWLATHRHPQKNYRGTGCIFSAAITANLALGYSIKDALVIAKMYVNRGLRLADPVNAKAALLTHGGWPENEIDLPFLADKPITRLYSFPDCGSLGLYPVVDSKKWLEKLLPLGVKTIQLRIKNKHGQRLENEIQQSISIAKKYQARLFINDYWELAIKHGAYGIHLGQEDLRLADMEKIQQAGLRLGISTHCYFEVARAHAFKPSYIACGPIYPTTSKVMPFVAQGIFNLQRWRRTLSNYRLVAIGGINIERIADVLSTNVDGVALIAAITQAENPEQMTNKLLRIWEREQCHQS